MVRLMSDFLHGELPIEQFLINDTKLVSDAHGQKSVQARVNGLLFGALNSRSNQSPHAQIACNHGTQHRLFQWNRRRCKVF